MCFGLKIFSKYFPFLQDSWLKKKHIRRSSDQLWCQIQKSGLGWTTRVAQMAKMCRIFRDQHFSHVFYLVILENGQKVQKVAGLGC